MTETPFEWQDGLDGLRATIAELHVHRAFVGVDETAIHIGGNYEIRDHELFNNTAWANTKTAWKSVLGFGPVNWRSGRDPAHPDRQLDLVALVQIGAYDLSFRTTSADSLEIKWSCKNWWLVPASVLHDGSRPDGRSTGRSLVDRSTIADYRITRHLTRRRLARLIALNEIVS